MTLKEIVRVCDVPCYNVRVSAGSLSFKTVAHNYHGEIDELIGMFGGCEVECIEIGDSDTLTIKLGELDKEALLRMVTEGWNVREGNHDCA